AATAVRPELVALTREVLRAMLRTRLEVAAAIMLAIATVGVVGTGLALRLPHPPAVRPAAAAEKPATQERPVAPRLLQVEKEDAWITYLAWAGDGNTLAAVTVDATRTPAKPDGSTLESVKLDGTAIRLWDVPSGRVKHTLADDQLEKPLWSLISFSPDGK